MPNWSGDPLNLDEYVIGVLPSEGIGPEIIGVTLDILEHLSNVSAKRFDISIGGKIGLPARIESGNALSREVIEFCQSVFSRRGAILCGPGGGRFVYDLRARFDLFCKFTPIRPTSALDDIGAIRPGNLTDVDMVAVRENHITAAGSIRAVLEQAFRITPPGIPIQIEVENMAQFDEAFHAGARMILLDNFSLVDMQAAVTYAAKRVELEASGGISLENVRLVAETGVDRISIGALTKDVTAIDLSMRFTLYPPS